jgi:hypothetical protein
MSGFERALGLIASLIAVGTFIWAISSTLFGANVSVSFELEPVNLPFPDIMAPLTPVISLLDGIIGRIINLISVIFEWASQNIVLKVFFYIVFLFTSAVIFSRIFIVPWVREQEPLIVPTLLSYLFFLGAAWVFDSLFLSGGLRLIAEIVLSDMDLAFENQGGLFFVAVAASLTLYAFGVNASASVARENAEGSMDFFERVFKGGGAPSGYWTIHGIASVGMAFVAFLTY